MSVFHYETTFLEYSERPVRFIIVKLILEGLRGSPAPGRYYSRIMWDGAAPRKEKWLQVHFLTKVRNQETSHHHRRLVSNQLDLVFISSLFPQWWTRDKTITKSRMSPLVDLHGWFVHFVVTGEGHMDEMG